MKRSVVRRPTISWQRLGNGTSAQGVIAYRGDLSGSGCRLHYDFDGWQEPIREARLESIAPGLALAELPDLAEHVAIDCAITDGDRWDNNHNINYRLWSGLEALHSHLHVSGNGLGALVVGNLRAAMASAGMICGISSWI